MAPASEYPVIVRIGISAGEPVEQGEDLFGSTVQLAARLCAQAEPGQTLVSNVVADLCIGKNLKFLDIGECQLKGFDRADPRPAVELAPLNLPFWATSAIGPPAAGALPHAAYCF